MKKRTKFIYLIICMMIMQVSKGEKLLMETIIQFRKTV
jgi:hypothetical protein